MNIYEYFSVAAINRVKQRVNNHIIHWQNNFHCTNEERDKNLEYYKSELDALNKALRSKNENN